jgi:NAD(P)H-hydrate epimerase
MIFAAVPESTNPILEAKLTEPMTFPMPETDGGLALTALTAIQSRSERVQAVAVGPGLGLSDEAGTLVGRMLELIDKPMVIDADALTALSESPSWWESRRGPTVITPHLGEMSRLTGMPPEDIEARRIDVALEGAARWGVVVVLKGAPTVTASPEGWATINPSGNPGMASAGMGDVLTGAVLALLAQGLPSYDAARLAAFIHGRAADRICGRRGVALTLASEVGGEIPMVLAELVAAAGESPLPQPLPEERHRPGEAEPPQDPASTGGQE